MSAAKRSRTTASILAALLLIGTNAQANDMPVPTGCAPGINTILAGLVARGELEAYNVMVCGTATETSKVIVPDETVRTFRHYTSVINGKRWPSGC